MSEQIQNTMLWLVTADLIHVGYVAFVVIGFVAILAGRAAGWHWVQNPYFSVGHVAVIVFLCCEALVGVTCSLTMLLGLLSHCRRRLILYSKQSRPALCFLNEWPSGFCPSELRANLAHSE